MQIRQLVIENFRGISKLDWSPAGSLSCIIGSGDSGKSTILDGIEAALSPRWVSFSEADFYNCDTSQPIFIQVTIGELSQKLLSDDRFGMFVRGWASSGGLHDEPEGDDEPVLTVQLTVDASLEPVWQIVCDRFEQPRTLSNRDRMLFGLVRLSGDDGRHLTWGQGSILARLNGDREGTAAVLAEAYRVARESANLTSVEALTTAASDAEMLARGFGAYVENSYSPGLEIGRSGLSANSISLHDGGVPLRLSGLGTRRLATLAIQKSAVSAGAIVLVDEIEHGLEPHRIVAAVSQLKADQQSAATSGRPIGQVFMTTHSDVVLPEITASELYISVVDRPQRVVCVRSPEAPEPINVLLRYTPRALFSRRIVVVEGMTEVGLIQGLKLNWPDEHEGVPIEQIGTAIADGNGAQAPSISCELAKLGYQVALFRDSDVALTDDEAGKLVSANVSVIEYGGDLSTEQAIFQAANDDRVQEILQFIRSEKDESAINDSIFPRIDGLDRDSVSEEFAMWSFYASLNDNQMRDILASIAKKKKWFKDRRVGREFAPLVWAIMRDDLSSPLSTTIRELEMWAYG